MSKPNLLYYFRRKEDIHTTLMQRLLDTWLAPLRELDDVGDPMTELRGYIRRKLEMARDFPRESRLFANEILQGAPRIMPMLEGDLKALVDEKAEVIKGWMRDGKIARTDPWHLIFSIWATTQHYADFDVQVRAVLGPDRGSEGRFEDAARYPGAALPRRAATEGQSLGRKGASHGGLPISRRSALIQALVAMLRRDLRGAVHREAFFRHRLYCGPHRRMTRHEQPEVALRTVPGNCSSRPRSRRPRADRRSAAPSRRKRSRR